MSILIDTKYVNLVSPQLQRFKRKSEYLWNFRCPLCGDSSKNKTKARGYFYRKKSNLFFQCHNCGQGLSVGNFLKQINASLYEQYRFDRYREESNGRNVSVPDFVKQAQTTRPDFIKPNAISLPTVASLDDQHSAKKFLVQRKIPKEKFSELYYAYDFRKFVLEWAPEYSSEHREYKNLREDEERIIIPFFSKENTLLGFQGRSLSNSGVRYITIKLNDETQKFYGLNHVDFSKKIQVVEGPFDSMFLPNSIAVMDASLQRVIPVIGADYDYVFIFDNEPSNQQIKKNMSETIETGRDICVWPSRIQEKDINAMVLAGHEPSDILHIIEQNTFSGLKAKLQFSIWKK